MKDENELRLGATLKYGNGKKSSLEAGMVDSNPNAHYNSNNSVILYDLKTQQNENNALAESTKDI